MLISRFYKRKNKKNMSFIRFKRLQKYINGLPVDEYMKGTERYDLIAYDSYFSCSQGYSQITRWVDTPVTECHNNNLCSMQKQQVSYDGGNSWSDTGVIQVKDIIEYESRECLSYLEEWRVIPNTFTCENYNKFSVEEEYISYDSGQTWEPTGQTRIGSLIEPLSTDCNVLYQWVTVPNEFICVGYDKFTLQKEQYSIDSGETWIDSGNERAGTLIEIQSSDCGYEPSFIYQWVIVQGEFICQGVDKYQKEKEQRSSDGGTTWTDTGNTRAGSLIERQSYDCGYISYRWITDPTTYECVNFDKYEVEKEQQTTDGTNWTDTGRTRTGSLIEHDSYDCGYISYRWIVVSGEYVCVGYDKHEKEKEQQTTDGTNWTDTGRTRAGQLIEQDSPSCGYIPPLPTDIKARFTYLNGVTYDVPLNYLDSDTRWLIRDEVTRGYTQTWDTYYYTHIATAIISDNITKIGENAFYCCSGLTSVIIPDTITLIGSEAFNGCSGLTSVIIPNSVIKINNGAFGYCTHLESITCESITPPTLGTNVFNNTNNCPIYVPCNSVNAYKTATNWSAYANRIQPSYNILHKWVTDNSTFECVGYDKFESRKEQISDDCGTNWTDTGNTKSGIVLEGNSPSCGYIPPSCSSDVKASVIYLNGDVLPINLNGSSTLTQAEIKRGITYSEHPHYYEKITSIVISDVVTAIENNAFNGCIRANEIVIPDTVTSIGTDSTFYYCYKIKSATIPNGTTTIGSRLFDSCRNLRGITIPNTVTSIGYNAFNSCYALAKIDIPSSVTSIGSYAFYSCGNLTSLTIPDSVTTLGDYAFAYCKGITNVTIGNGVTSINQYAFNYCTGLTNVTIGNGVTSIGYNAFYACFQLTSFTCLATTPPTLSSQAFSSTNNNFIIYVPAAKVQAYKSAANWSTYASRIQAIP